MAWSSEFTRYDFHSMSWNIKGIRNGEETHVIRIQSWRNDSREWRHGLYEYHYGQKLDHRTNGHRLLLKVDM